MVKFSVVAFQLHSIRALYEFNDYFELKRILWLKFGVASEIQIAIFPSCVEAF